MSSQQDSLFYFDFHYNVLECNALKPEMSCVKKPLTLSEQSINNLCSPLNLSWENHLAWVERGKWESTQYQVSSQTHWGSSEKQN